MLLLIYISVGLLLGAYFGETIASGAVEMGVIKATKMAFWIGAGGGAIIGGIGAWSVYML